MSKYTENFPNLSTYDFDTIMCQLRQVCGADPSGLINAQFLSRPTTAKDIALLLHITYELFQAQVELQKQFVELYTFVKDFFENLDLQEEVNQWLDDALKNGELENIIQFGLNIAKLIPTTQEMINNENLKKDMVIQTKGFYDIGDGGGGLFLIGDNGEINLDNGLKAKCIVSKITLKMLGAKENENVNDLLKNLSGTIYITEKYTIVPPISLQNGVKIIGESGGELMIDDSVGNYSFMLKIGNDTEIDGLKINGNKDRGTYNNIDNSEFNTFQTLLYATNVKNIKIKNCIFYVSGVWGVSLDYAVNSMPNENILIENNIFNCYQGMHTSDFLDQSVLYLHGNEIEVTKNLFNGFDVIQTAIEEHNNINFVANENEIRNFYNSIIITCLEETGEEQNVLLKNNKFLKVCNGINIYVDKINMGHIYIMDNYAYLLKILDTYNQSNFVYADVGASGGDIEYLCIANNEIESGGISGSYTSEYLGNYSAVWLNKPNVNTLILDMVNNVLKNINGRAVTQSNQAKQGTVNIFNNLCDVNHINPSDSDSITIACISLNNLTTANVKGNLYRTPNNQNNLNGIFATDNINVSDNKLIVLGKDKTYLKTNDVSIVSNTGISSDVLVSNNIINNRKLSIFQINKVTNKTGESVVYLRMDNQMDLEQLIVFINNNIYYANNFSNLSQIPIMKPDGNQLNQNEINIGDTITIFSIK